MSENRTITFVPAAFRERPSQFVFWMAIVGAAGAAVGVIATWAGYPINPGLTAAAMMVGSWLHFQGIKPEHPTFWGAMLGFLAGYHVLTMLA